MILIYRQVYNAFRWQVMMFLCGADDSLLMRKLKFHPFVFSINWCFKAMDCMQENWGKQKSSHFLKMCYSWNPPQKIMSLPPIKPDLNHIRAPLDAGGIQRAGCCEGAQVHIYTSFLPACVHRLPQLSPGSPIGRCKGSLK